MFSDPKYCYLEQHSVLRTNFFFKRHSIVDCFRNQFSTAAPEEGHFYQETGQPHLEEQHQHHLQQQHQQQLKSPEKTVAKIVDDWGSDEEV
jgi:hypothetical protein